MPNKHFYFAMGAANGVMVVYAIRKARHWLYQHTKWMRRLYQWDRDWFLYFPFLIALFGVMALTPDILHALHVLPKEETRGPVFNLFYFHSYFERLENTNPKIDWLLNSIGSIALAIIAIGILFFYVAEAKRIGRCVNKAGNDKNSKSNKLQRTNKRHK